MTPATHYQARTKELLATEWAEETQPQIRAEDLDKAIELFVQVALDKIAIKQSKHALGTLDLSEKKAKVPDEATYDHVMEKVTAYVKKKSYYFKLVCETGFPFSSLEHSASINCLKHMLKHPASITAHFLLQDDTVWLSEQELDTRFKEPFTRLNSREIALSCFELHQKLSQNNDSKAGFYLLWLIKQSTHADFEIPPKETFTKEMVTQVLSNFIANKGKLQFPHLLIETLLFKKCVIDNPLYLGVLNSEQHAFFLNYALDCLKTIPTNVWPAKTEVISDFLEYMDGRNKRIIANVLSSSSDMPTARIGSHVFAALQADTFQEAIAHFNALIELMPHINHVTIEIIFGRPFVGFLSGYTHLYKDDPHFTRRLNFNRGTRVFIEENLMIGVYDKPMAYGNNCIPPHLLAYDMNTEKMAWGVALTPSVTTNQSIAASRSSPDFGFKNYSLQQCGTLLYLQFKDTSDVYSINAKTGEIVSKVTLPHQMTDTFDRLYVTATGVGYQMVMLNKVRTLVVGKMVDGTWQTTYESKTPAGLFIPLSTHVGFHDDFRTKLQLFGPTGASIKIENCISVESDGDKLYLIQKDPEMEETCILSVRTLVADERVATDEIQRFQLNTPEASILKLCNNGLCVLLSAQKNPIFVNLLTSEIVYSQNKLDEIAKYVVNKNTGEIWSWDEISCNVFKTTATESTLMGNLKSGSRTSLVHADSSDRLFFLNMRY